MTKSKNTYVDAEKLTLAEWLNLLFSKNRNIDFIDYEFPTDKHREEYFRTIQDREEKDVLRLIKQFLIPSCSLGTDRSYLRYIISERKKNSELNEFIMGNQYSQRLLLWAASKGRTPPPWEGITWILDLLPHWPRIAVQALDAYFLAHAQFFPDGRFRGLGEAVDLIRHKFIGMPSTSGDKIEHLMEIPPRSFECIVEQLYKEMGFRTELTPEKADGGRDIVAEKNDAGKKEKTLIECKRYRKPVGVKIVRELLGVISSEKVNKGVIATSSSFTRGAKELALDNPRIELISGNRLVPLFNEYLGPKWPLNIESFGNFSISLGGIIVSLFLPLPYEISISFLTDTSIR